MPTATEHSTHPVFLVHRIGAAVVALILWAFAILGFLSGTGFVTTHGAHALGMTGDGLLSTISVVVGVVLMAAAAIGGRMASTACVVVGGLFVVSGLANLFVLNKSANLLAFTMPNVIFSLVVGLILLSIGLYGRGSSQLPADNPYRQARGGANPMARIWQGEGMAQEPVENEEEAERRLDEVSEMAEAEYKFAEGTATPEQEHAVLEDAARRTQERREEAWRRAEDDERA